MMKTQAENERETLGALLRRTREEQGLTFAQAVDATKISPKSLQALEDDDYANLPAEAFVRGFYTIYADYLSLDQEEIRSRYNQQARQLPKDDGRTSPTPGELAQQTSSMAEPSLVTSRSVIGLSLVALVLAGIAACWYLSFNPITYLSSMLSGANAPSPTADQPAAPAAAPDQPPAVAPPAQSTPAQSAPAPSAAPEVGASPPTTAAPADQGSMAAPTTTPPATSPASPPIAAESAGPVTPVPAAYTLRATFKTATRATVKVDDQPAQHFDFTAGATHNWKAGKAIVITLPAGSDAKMFLNGLPLALPAGPAGEEITISIPQPLPQ